MTDQNGLDRQNSNGTYLDGPLKGQTAVSILIGERETHWLQHASRETGYTLDQLAQISVEEAAIRYANDNKLT